jgi:hypothetical protein
MWVAVGRYWVTRKARQALINRGILIKISLATLNLEKEVSQPIIPIIKVIKSNYV